MRKGRGAAGRAKTRREGGDLEEEGETLKDRLLREREGEREDRQEESE